MTAHLDDWTKRQERYGYKRISDSRCPRRLVGKRHLGEQCWCASRLNDHAATYTRHGHRLVLWEPYQGYPEDMADMFAAAHADGLRVIVLGSSPYNPGSTLAIEFGAREAAS
ncbi:hypothetical protein BH11ACT1_BH11ACT1_19290 [soil metagenome]